MKNKIVFIIISFLLLSGVNGCPNRSSNSSSVVPTPGPIHTNSNINTEPVETTYYYQFIEDSTLYNRTATDSEDRFDHFRINGRFGSVGGCGVNLDSLWRPLTQSAGCYFISKRTQKEQVCLSIYGKIGLNSCVQDYVIMKCSDSFISEGCRIIKGVKDNQGNIIYTYRDGERQNACCGPGATGASP